MPTCLRCNTSFPNRKIINGKYRILNGRKYCLECSPFGQHNTTKIHEVDRINDGSVTICKICKRKYFYSRSKGHTFTVCNTCWSNKRKQKMKRKLVEYGGGKCQKCGYCSCPDVLHFHHLNPKYKVFSIGGNYNRSWEILKKEANKCILLCANCHIEEEYNIRGLAQLV